MPAHMPMHVVDLALIIFFPFAGAPTGTATPWNTHHSGNACVNEALREKRGFPSVAGCRTSFWAALLAGVHVGLVAHWHLSECWYRRCEPLKWVAQEKGHTAGQ